MTITKIISLLIINLLICTNIALACHVEVSCINSNGDGSSTAYFNYIGDGNSHTYALGSKNKFSPAPQNRGQPTVFKGTKITDVFFVTFTDSVSWYLNSSSATANSTSAACKTHKVQICHIPPGNPSNAHTIDIDEHALDAHLAHGDAKGACTFDCMGVPLGKAIIDSCGVCGGDSSTCKDCAGVPNGNAKEDLCGVCNGDNSSCKDCSGTPNGDLVTDLCEVCGGDSSSCKDCAGVPNGDSIIDLCGVCNGQSNTCLDCAGVPNGKSKLDQCGVCNGNGTSCLDCAGVPNGKSKLDQCGVCDSNSENDNTTCVDCLGVVNGLAKPDLCGVCGGDSSSCKDCAGVPNGSSRLDRCGVCGGNNTTCVDCLGEPNGGAMIDACGVCQGNGSSCSDCLGIPNGPNKLDLCGVCGNNFSSNNLCLDCSGVPNGGTTVDKCGVCGGNGGNLVRLKINKKLMLRQARIMLSQMTLPYFKKAVKCGNKKLGKEAVNAVVVYNRVVETINALITELRLCPGECQDKINAELLVRLNKLVEESYKSASKAQHGAGLACKIKGAGIRGTRPVADLLIHEGHSCQTKACIKS